MLTPSLAHTPIRPESPVAVTPPGIVKSASKEELMDAKKNAASDMMQFELMRKRDLEERLKDVQLKATYPFSTCLLAC